MKNVNYLFQILAFWIAERFQGDLLIIQQQISTISFKHFQYSPNLI